MCPKSLFRLRKITTFRGVVGTSLQTWCSKRFLNKRTGPACAHVRKQPFGPPGTEPHPGGGAEPSPSRARAEPSPSRAEPGRAEPEPEPSPSRAEPEPEPSRAGPDRTEPSRAKNFRPTGEKLRSNVLLGVGQIRFAHMYIYIYIYL
jgi:hypothetical protein